MKEIITLNQTAKILIIILNSLLENCYCQSTVTVNLSHSLLYVKISKLALFHCSLQVDSHLTHSCGPNTDLVLLH